MRKQVEIQLEFLLKQERLPGLAAVMIAPSVPEGQIWAMGFIERGSKHMVKPQTSFRIGRLSETISALVLREGLKERGVDLDSALSKHVPKSFAFPSYRGKEITFRHLLLHQSAFPSLLPSFFHPDDATQHQILELVRKMHLKGEPGAQYSSALMNYPMAALLFEKISHLRFFSCVEEKMSALGMRKTGLHPRDNPRSLVASARGFCSSPTDLAKWIRYHLAHPPEISTGATALGAREISMGWEIEKINEHTCFFAVDRYLEQSVFCGFIPHSQVGFALLIPHPISLEVIGKAFLQLLDKGEKQDLPKGSPSRRHTEIPSK